MGLVRPLRGVRYNQARVDLNRVLAPPYDVITPEAQDDLYARDPHNIVRVDFARGERRYDAARSSLATWLEQGILLPDQSPSYYVVGHEFVRPGGGAAHRRGVIGRIDARPWETAPIRPHERTLRGPKEDRLALMKATGMQSSAVFGLWSAAPDVNAVLRGVCDLEPDADASLAGEFGEERIQLWVVSDEARVRAIESALDPAQLYIADGHHRYETAAAWTSDCLVYLCAADDPGLCLLPTHRLIREGADIPDSVAEITSSLGGRFQVAGMPNWEAALAEVHQRRSSAHAFALIAHDGALAVSRVRQSGIAAQDALDVSVLESEILRPWGITAEALREGVLSYEQSPASLAFAVDRRDAVLGIALNGCSTAELMAISDAGGTMPQKSTYFYPKVPTGLVLLPL